MPLQTISFRAQTTSAVSEICFDEKLECARSQRLISYLCGQVVNYKEEGREIELKILFCEDVSLLLSYIPGSISYKIGETAFEDDAYKKILKECAPLCNDEWHLYIARLSDKKLEYGVFSFASSPTSLSLQDTISLFKDNFALLIHRSNIGTAEIVGSKGSFYHFEFSTTRQEHSDGSDSFALFASDCASSIEIGPTRDSFIVYFNNTIRRAALQSHGTMFICIDDFEQHKPNEVQDAVLIKPKLDFYTAFLDYINSNSADAIISLRRLEVLFFGFCSSDGIVVFDKAGGVVAYRGFYRGEIEIPEVVGGSRRRAFEGLRTLVGDVLQSALFQSQDGVTIYQG